MRFFEATAGRPFNLAQRIQDGLVARRGNPIDLLAKASAVRDHVIDLAVVSENVDVDFVQLDRLDFGIVQVQSLIQHDPDRFFGLIQCHARHVGRAIDSQAHRAIHANEVLPLHGLLGQELATHLNQQNVRRLDLIRRQGDFRALARQVRAAENVTRVQRSVVNDTRWHDGDWFSAFLEAEARAAFSVG